MEKILEAIETKGQKHRWQANVSGCENAFQIELFTYNRGKFLKGAILQYMHTRTRANKNERIVAVRQKGGFIDPVLDPIDDAQ